MKSFENIENISKEIFKDSFVLVEQVNDPEIRHIYLKHNITGEQILELQKRFRILFVSQTYDEDDKKIGQKTAQVVLITQLEEIPEIEKQMLKHQKFVCEVKDYIDECLKNELTAPVILESFKKFIEERIKAHVKEAKN